MNLKDILTWNCLLMAGLIMFQLTFFLHHLQKSEAKWTFWAPMVVQWLTLLPHSKKAWSLNPPSICLGTRRFPLKVQKHAVRRVRLTNNCKLPIGANGCLSLWQAGNLSSVCPTFSFKVTGVGSSPPPLTPTPLRNPKLGKRKRIATKMLWMMLYVMYYI